MFISYWKVGLISDLIWSDFWVLWNSHQDTQEKKFAFLDIKKNEANKENETR